MIAYFHRSGAFHLSRYHSAVASGGVEDDREYQIDDITSGGKTKAGGPSSIKCRFSHDAILIRTVGQYVNCCCKSAYEKLSAPTPGLLEASL